jgi:hypothetical protein
MSNIIALDQITVPAFLQNRTADNSMFLAGLPQGGGFPTIGLKGTRFVVKADGSETVLPTVEISVVLIAAKQNLNKTYYASKFDPSQTEAKSPDCFSNDGVKPDVSATMKQCDSCAGCAQNQFGSGTAADGTPSKGKACSDTKTIAIFANNGTYGFRIPPASLKAFGHYVKETSRRGVDLSTAITVIGFDPNFSYPVLTFNFAGFLNPEQVDKVAQMKTSIEVMDIVGGTAAPAVSQTAPAKQVEAPKPAAPADPFATVVEVAPVAKPTKVQPIKKAEKPVEVASVEDDDLAGLAAELGLTL